MLHADLKRAVMMTLSGCHVALVTPFDADGQVDADRLAALIERHVDWGTDGLVAAGTTAETPTLTQAEYKQLVEDVISASAGRVPVIVGTGSSDTRKSMIDTRFAADAGATAALVVMPYYNRPSQEGLVRHFQTLNEVGLPLIAYNIPSRTGTNLEPQTLERIANACENVVAVKESSGLLDQVSAISSALDGRIVILSGDDSLTLPILSVGGVGVISVAANFMAQPVRMLVEAFAVGDTRGALQLHQQFFPLFRALLALAPSPVPVKEAMRLVGLDAGAPRLPLVELGDGPRQMLAELLIAAGFQVEASALAPP